MQSDAAGRAGRGGCKYDNDGKGEGGIAHRGGKRGEGMKWPIVLGGKRY